VEAIASSAAELTFPTIGLRLTAQIAGSTDAGILVQPRGLSDLDTAVLGRIMGAPIWLHVVTGRDTYRIPCFVQGISIPLLLLICTSPAERMCRRDRKRFACKLPVVYRVLRSSASTSAWHPAELIDINNAGARIKVPDRKQFPTKVELQISLPSDTRRSANYRTTENEPESDHIVKVSARPRHGQFTSSGETVVGLRFEYLAPECRLSLGCYLEELASFSHR
jgi:hypothetical protein